MTTTTTTTRPSHLATLTNGLLVACLLGLGATAAAHGADGAAAADPDAAKTTATAPGGSAGTDATTGKAVDNTGVNKRDRGDDAAVTPQDQNLSESDRKLLQQARRAITKDDSLSMAAHNVKIIVNDGHATLRGPVKDADEKAKVSALVKAVPGITAVDDATDVTNR